MPRRAGSTSVLASGGLRCDCNGSIGGPEIQRCRSLNGTSRRLYEYCAGTGQESHSEHCRVQTDGDYLRVDSAHASGTANREPCANVFRSRLRWKVPAHPKHNRCECRDIFKLW